MMNTDRYFLGYDIGGTKIAVCVGDQGGNILADTRIAGGTTQQYQEVLPAMLRAADEVAGQAGIDLKQIEACGVSAPGPLDLQNGLILKSPNMDWDNVPVRDDVSSNLNKPVFFDNDANGGALAEQFFGAGRDCRNMIYLTMSTGIGGGVICDGDLIHGRSGNAGELGHIVLDPDGPQCGCGMNGCFEAFCGGRSVAQRLRQWMRQEPCEALLNLPEVNGDVEKLDYITLRKGVNAGIPEAETFWDNICRRTAQALGAYIMTFDPDAIVLGTLALYSGDMFMKPVREYLQDYAWNNMLSHCRLRISELGSNIGELAGVAVALYGMDRQETTAPR